MAASTSELAELLREYRRGRDAAAAEAIHNGFRTRHEVAQAAKILSASATDVPSFRR
jgi:hypothetical protein